MTPDERDPKTVPPQSEAFARPQRNGGGDRLDDLSDAVQSLTNLAQRGVTVAELAHHSAEKARDAVGDLDEKMGGAMAELAGVRSDFKEYIAEARKTTREVMFLRQDSGRMRTELVALAGDVKVQRHAVERLENFLGRWPQGPDDTGSGLAGLVARDSQIDAEERERLKSSTPPPVKWFQKRHPKIALAVAITTTVGVTIWQVIHALMH